MQLHQARIIEKKQLSPNEWKIVFDAPELCIEARPGQFVMVECGGKTFLRRAISINDCYNGKLSLMFAVVGEGTQALANMEINDEVSLLGPLGNGFDYDIQEKNVVFIAGGIGKAPFEFLSRKILENNNNIIIIAGGRDIDALAGLECFQNKEDVQIFYATEDGSFGKKGFVTTYFEQLEGIDRIYTCGPTPMLKAVQSLADSRKIPCQLSLEGKMACGVGVCLGCTCRPKDDKKIYPKVCQDGPVFWSEEVCFNEL